MNENCVICLAIKLSSGIIFYVQINKIRIKWTTTSFCFTTSCSIPPIKDMVVLETQHCKRWSAACVQAKEATERRSWNNISIISIIYRPITYLRVISREQSLWSILLSRGKERQMKIERKEESTWTGVGVTRVCIGQVPVEDTVSSFRPRECRYWSLKICDE